MYWNYDIHAHCGTLTALEEGNSLLDQLRLLKSRLEGSHYKFQPPSFSSDLLTELRLLSTAFTPATLNDATKAKISDKLHQLFDGQVKRVVHACLLTCPWFAAAQSEVSAQARNNILYVIYTASDEQFFSLASPHERALGETLDEVGKCMHSINCLPPTHPPTHAPTLCLGFPDQAGKMNLIIIIIIIIIIM